ncbi:MAG: D-alanyl-D-alanine carboxypeptidase family protein [Acidimicrobiales bacterium]
MKPLSQYWRRRGPLRTVVFGTVVTLTALVAVPNLGSPHRALVSPTTSVPSTTTTIGLSSVTPVAPSSPVPHALRLPWPSVASAAVAVPSLSIAATSARQPVVPIASITKLMTAWVVLQRLPLALNQRGPCLQVSASDVALYNYDVATDQSSVKVALGETLCEGMLLRGMLVHSAGNFAQMLIELAHMSDARFVNEMNKTALSFGLKHTHYVDYSGISAGDVSTAQEQSVVAVNLMTNEPVVRQIVALPSVRLPVAGAVASYTPYEGQYGVVGVKSGYTIPAGGCDVMAINVNIDHTVIPIYAVVIGVHGANAINRSGFIGLQLLDMIRSRIRIKTTATGRVVQWVGWPGYVTTTTTTTAPTTTTTGPSSSTTSSTTTSSTTTTLH